MIWEKHKYKFKNYFLCFSFFIILLFSFFNVAELLDANEEKLVDKIQANYGNNAARRVIDWRLLIRKSQDEHFSEMQKLKQVNDLLNSELFISDIELWGKNDYWASPLEFLGAGAGDCEDFTIAKYFTLREMGVEDVKLRLIYVKALQLNQFHMVLAYYPTPASVPLILDNIDKSIKPANLRNDLLPIYSFNATNLWLMKSKGIGVAAGSSSRLSAWNDVRSRFNSQVLQKPIFNAGY